MAGAKPRKARTDYARVVDQFPSIKSLNWRAAFARDRGLYARILNDVLKADQAEAGRPGPRPALDRQKAQRRLTQFMGEDHTILPFVEAVKIMSRNASVRKLADLTGLNRSVVFRLMKGTVEPDEYELKQFATAFDKHPSFFLEYRINFVLSALAEMMLETPEASIGTYHKLRKAL